MEDSKLRNAIEAFYLRYGFGTRCLHAGEKVGQPKLKSHTNAIFATSTFTFDNAEEGADLFARRSSGYIYTRLGNPTVVVAEAKLNALEGRDVKLADPECCIASLLYSSGMAAIASLSFALLHPGDHGSNMVAPAPLGKGRHTEMLSATAWNCYLSIPTNFRTDCPE